MRLGSVKLTESELNSIDPAFATTRAGYKKRATIIFTNGKTHKLWAGGSPTDMGITYPFLQAVNEEKRFCVGMCLVDLYAHVARVGSETFRDRGRAKRNGLRPDSLRHAVLITTVHELFHIQQAWMIGKNFGRDFVEEAISSENRWEDYAEVNPAMGNAYLQNMFEAGAFDFTSRWWETNAEAINKGRFDFLLPMATMRGIFPELSNAYP
ncbi:MAG: hypothetical protein AB7V18_14840 [Pyrinomonadaceae bacterium]